MFAKMHSDTMLKLKKWGYLAFWAAVLPLLPMSAFIGRESGTQDYWAWFLYFVVFGIIPVLDYIIGKDPSNPDEHQQVPSMSQERIYTSALFLMGFIWVGRVVLRRLGVREQRLLPARPAGLDCLHWHRGRHHRHQPGP